MFLLQGPRLIGAVLSFMYFNQIHLTGWSGVECISGPNDHYHGHSGFMPVYELQCLENGKSRG